MPPSRRAATSQMPSLEPSPSHCEPFHCLSLSHKYDAHNMQSIKSPPRARNREHRSTPPRRLPRPGDHTKTFTRPHSPRHMHAPTAPTTHPSPSPMHDPCSPRAPHSHASHGTSPAPRRVPLALLITATPQSDRLPPEHIRTPVARTTGACTPARVPRSHHTRAHARRSHTRTE
jgi:hypothetical protein